MANILFKDLLLKLSSGTSTSTSAYISLAQRSDMAMPKLKSMGDALPLYHVLKGKDPEIVMSNTATVVTLIKIYIFTEKSSRTGSLDNPKSLHYLHPKKVEIACITSDHNVSLNFRHHVQKEINLAKSNS